MKYNFQTFNLPFTSFLLFSVDSLLFRYNIFPSTICWRRWTIFVPTSWRSRMSTASAFSTRRTRSAPTSTPTIFPIATRHTRYASKYEKTTTLLLKLLPGSPPLCSSNVRVKLSSGSQRERSTSYNMVNSFFKMAAFRHFRSKNIFLSGLVFFTENNYFVIYWYLLNYLVSGFDFRRKSLITLFLPQVYASPCMDR